MTGMNRILRKQGGFTLIEAVIAIGVVGFVLLVLVSLVVQHVMLIDVARTKMVALNHANAVLEEMRNCSYTSLNSITSRDWTSWSDNNGYNTLDQEVIAVQYGASPDPLSITVTVNWMIKDRQHLLQLTTDMTKR